MSGGQMLTAEKSRRTLTRTGNGPSSCGARGGFTLIELLVVISIVVLLMAVLLPALQRARKQAKAVACQAKLRQWGVVFSMYMNEHNDQFDNREGHQTVWWLAARSYYADCDDLLLCPMATRYKVNRNDPKWELNMNAGWGVGDKFTPWKAPDLPDLNRGAPFYGSYAWNICVLDTYSAQGSVLKRLPRPAWPRMPFLLDSTGQTGYGHSRGSPPLYDGDLSEEAPPSNSLMKPFCIDRHSETINSLFTDWSVRRVGLKEIWTLKWHGGYDTRGPWTKAGGVQAEDWPAWMRRFKDY